MAKFNELPAELRNVLYAGLLRNSHPAGNELAIFMVSKQIHEESTSYFYQHNNIAIYAPSTTTGAATILPPIADKYIQFLRRLTIYTLTGQARTPSVQKAATTIASLAAIGTQLDELSITIMSPLSHFLNSRVDDSILDISHPITVALLQLLASGVAKTTCIELKNAWFAPGVAHTLHAKFGSRLRFSISDAHTMDPASLERPLTGRYSSKYLTTLDLSYEDLDSCSIPRTSISSMPSSLPSSVCSALADLDTFSVSSFEMKFENEAAKDELGESSNERDTSEQPFFTDDDIEEWQASTLEFEQEDVDNLQDMDLDVDEEMEDVPQGDVQMFMNNLEETAHHVANTADVTYLANFAPDLLLSRHHLGHL
ncbi:uncharacterized protein K460DRAFT_252641, partial [Cucurbitaria berberidis CBS 394.84]